MLHLERKAHCHRPMQAEMPRLLAHSRKLQVPCNLLALDASLISKFGVKRL